MKIDGINMEDIYKIEYGYDNIGVLKIIQHLLGVVLNDIDYMNDTYNVDEDDDLDLGNNNRIKKEDYESLYSTIDTIFFILQDNEESE